MIYDIRPLPSFERPFSKLAGNIQRRIAEKLEFLAQHPEVIVSPMKNLPNDLRGLHKIRVGPWRIFFWVDRGKREITPYDVGNRDKVYKLLRK